MSKRTFTHIAEVDLGELGLHVGMFTALIDAQENRFGWSYYVEIMKVTVDVVIARHSQVINVTEAFSQKDHVRKKWEDEILKDYQGIMQGKLEEYG